jgi:hypothetical protein
MKGGALPATVYFIIDHNTESSFFSGLLMNALKPLDYTD